MITHHPSLLRPSIHTLRAGFLGRRPTLNAFLSTTVASAPPSTPPLRLRSLHATAGGTSPVSGDGGKRSVPSPTLGAALLGFVRSNFLPLALIGGVILGLLDPTIGCLAHKYSLSKYSTFGIFAISGLTLRTRELGAALEAWPAGLYGLASILLFTPFFAQFIMQVQFFPREFITGLALFCCMPTTLSSGVALTQLVGGNSALALAMTVASNLLGIIIIPLSLAKYIGTGVGVSLPTGQLFKSLVTSLLIPLIIGKVARETSKGPVDSSFFILLFWLSMLQCWRSCHVLNRKGSQSLRKKSTHELSFWWPVRKHCQCWLPWLSSLEEHSGSPDFWSSLVLPHTLTRSLLILS